MEPLRIEIASQDLADLQQRISRTRLPDQQEGVAWEQGTPSTYLQVLHFNIHCVFWAVK